MSRDAGKRGLVLIVASLISTACVAGFAYVVSGASRVLSESGWAGPTSLVALVRHDLLSLTPVAGRPAVVVAWVLLAVGLLAPTLALLMPRVGDRVVGTLAIPVATSLPAVLPSVAMVLVVRWGVILLPEATRWASLSVAVIGALMIAHGVLIAATSRRLGGLTMALLAGQVGVALVGLGAVTSQGVGAVLLMAPAQLVTIVGVVVMTRSLSHRAGTDEISKLGGTFEWSTPFASNLLVVWIAAVGVPLSPVGWPAIAAIYGVLATHRWVALAAAILMGALGVASVRRWVRVLLGAFPEALRRSPELEPSGGKFPTLTANERLAIAVVQVELVVLGLVPRPWTALVERAALDAGSFVVGVFGPK
jgi:NADH:ubiquinone oxidoreductase subunit 4 (subunit M)